MKFSYLAILLLAVDVSCSASPSSDDSDDNGKIHFAPVTSSRSSLNNHETRVQKLTAACDTIPAAILRQIVWHVDPDKPIDRVEVRIGEQKLYAYQNNKAVGISPISTARPGYVTPLGSYKICDKQATYFSNLYGEFADARGSIVNWNANLGQTPPQGAHYVPSPMPFFMRLTDDGMGMHGGYLPGYPDSHGCIRLPPSVAENIFHQVSVGTTVDVVH